MRKRSVALLAFAAVAVATALGFNLWPDQASPVVDAAATAVVAGGAAGSRADLLPALAAHLDKHPRDARAWAIVARLKFGGQDFAGAGAAYARAVELPGKVARDPLVWCEYADALAMATGGRIAGKPRQLIDHALALDGKHPRALEMAGSAEIEAGNHAGALRYWEELLSLLPADSPARAELATAVERTRMRAGR